MTVYYYDLFTGTAGTPLTSHTADSGATWPNDANHLYEYNSIQLDGNGAVFLEGTQPTLEIPSATQPSSQNFEVLFTFNRLSALSGSSSGVELLRQAPFTGSTEDYAFDYTEGSGFAFLHNGAAVGGYAAGPAVGTLWYLKVDVSTSGANTNFASYYSTTSGGPWTALTNYSVATPSDAVAAGLRFTGTSATTTTGHHIGDLTVQDIPALSSATLSGPTQQLFSTPAEFTVDLNEAAGTGGVVVTLSSSNSSDTFQATQGGANVTTITIPSGSESGTFWLTPRETTGNRTITIATSPTLTYSGSPFAYNAMTTATGYTVTGASGGHQLVPATWSITLVGGDFSGTITATPSNVLTGTASLSVGSAIVNGTGTSFLTQIVVGVTYTFGSAPYMVASVQSNVLLTLTTEATANASTVAVTSGQCEIFTPVVVTFLGNGTLSQTFSFTPFSADSVVLNFTNSGGLTNPASTAYLSTRMYFLDQFVGASGTSITGWDSNSLPGLAGSPYTVAGSIELDGNGMTFMSSGTSASAITQAVLPVFTTSTSLEILFDIEQVSHVASYGGIYLMSDNTGKSMTIQLSYAGTPTVYVTIDGTYDVNANTQLNIPPVGTRWHIKLNFIPDSSQETYLYTYYSLDGINWLQLMTAISPPIGIDPTTLPASFAVGPFFSGVAGSTTTGVHIGNIIVQDVSPASPNCQISNAYITSSGQSIMLFYETIDGNTPVVPSSLNYPLSFFLNGSIINPADIHYWVGSGASCAGVLLPAGVQVYSTDTVTMLAPASAIALGTGNASVAISTPHTLTNNAPTSAAALGSGKSCFGTDTLAKTMKPGTYVGYNGVDSNNPYSIFANLRYRLPSTVFAQNSNDGYPVTLNFATLGMDFVDCSLTNNLDATEYPVKPGHYALGYDDLAYGTSNECNLSLIATAFTPAETVVTQVTSCNNPGSNGIGQFYLFNVQQASGSSVANIPISLQWYMPNGGSSPNIANLYILGPGDFTVPSLTNTSWSFPRPTAPGPLSSQWTANLYLNSCGCMRWMDPLCGQGSAGTCNTCEPWEMHELYDFSWNNSNYVAASVVTLTTARALSSPYIYADQFGSSWTPETSSSVAITLGANVTELISGSGTVSVVTGSTSVTFSASQSGLTGLAFVCSGDATGTYNNLIIGGSGTSWTLSSPYKGPTNATATWSTLQSTLTLSGTPQTGDAPFYGVTIKIDSEYMRCVGISGTTVNVVRASAFNQVLSTPATHSSGASITLYNRWPIVGIPLSSSNSQWVEFVTATPHNFKAGQLFGQASGTLPTMTCTDGSTLAGWPGRDSCLVWPTGQLTFALMFQGTTSTGVTLGPSTAYPTAPTSYSLSGVTIQNYLPPAGMPHEAAAIATAQLPGCNIHINLPLLVSDSFCYNAALKIKNNFPAGRKVYVELADEPWNWGSPIYYQVGWFDQFLSHGEQNAWYVIRIGQIRSIFRTVFGSRANEIYMLANVWQVYAANQPMLSVAQTYNVIIDAYTVACYIFPTENSQATPISTAAWNAASIPQMADLFIHDVWYNPTNTTSFVGPTNGSVPGTHWAYIQSYNTWLAANFPGSRPCVLCSYECGFSQGAPDTCTTCSSGVNLGMGGSGYGNICPALNRDISYDPVWRIYEKDFYALMQSLGFTDMTIQSNVAYYFYQSDWAMFVWGHQPPGKGDGSDGKANNRLCLATPGYPYSKASTTNQDQQNVSVRGQAFLEWMQPAQDKKRMLFVPFRFVNR